MVPDNSSFPASPSPPPLSKSGVGYFADYKPISSYARSWNGQRLPSQQNVVSNTTHGNDSASDNTTRGCKIKRNQAQADHSWSDGDNKQGIQPTPHSSHTVESSTRIEAPLLHPGSDVRNLRSKRIKACWNNDFVNTFNQESGLNDTAIEISIVENLTSKCMENLTPKHTPTFMDNILRNAVIIWLVHQCKY
ncbi:hypothetical protein RHMOL_Rhmol04G0336500 [Rhododendron molle]|uniref:Uncharacterized protein n=1 Tax=Rhododendron molle TaxID=49168 RepID=A0ACC0P764_RHOML|nr:hypothetical protein RHMOL_Rhmol04G0336500 [Rhododendron molle]